jgi:hypothetical protein
MTKQKPPKELDAIADVVLAYRPKPKTKLAKKRKKLAATLSKSASLGHSKAEPQRK